MIKILLMEDDLNLCQSIQQALKKEGYSVDCCNDGESAMIYALNTDYGYDLAIVDRMFVRMAVVPSLKDNTSNSPDK